MFFSTAHPLPPSHCSQSGSVGCSPPWHDKGGLFSSACLVLTPLSPLSAFAGLAVCLSHTPVLPWALLSALCSLWCFLCSPCPFSNGGSKSRQRSAADFHTSHFPSNTNSTAEVGKAFPGARGFPWWRTGTGLAKHSLCVGPGSSGLA